MFSLWAFLQFSLFMGSGLSSEVMETPTPTEKTELYVYINADNDIIGIDENDQAFHYGNHFFDFLTGIANSFSENIGLHIYFDPSREIMGATSSQIIEFCGKSAPVIERLGETDSTDANYFTKLTRQSCFSNDPFKKVLILWGHGNSWKPINAFDFSSPDISQSFVGLIKSDTNQFDLIIYDNCMMGSIEVAMSTTSHAKAMIASQFALPPEGIEYKSLLTLLNSNASIETWMQTLMNDTGERTRTQGAFAPLIGVYLSQLIPLVQEFNASTSILLNDKLMIRKLAELSRLPEETARDMRALSYILKSENTTNAQGVALESELLKVLAQSSGSLSFSLPSNPQFLADNEKNQYLDSKSEEFAQLSSFQWVLKQLNTEEKL